jgi:hypothetical protein
VVYFELHGDLGNIYAPTVVISNKPPSDNVAKMTTLEICIEGGSFDPKEMDKHVDHCLEGGDKQRVVVRADHP